ncbi:bacterial regulatory helix-turn-helix, lysR family protein, partial [Vibrio parahaemolyticus V-223/04]
STCCARWR